MFKILLNRGFTQRFNSTSVGKVYNFEQFKSLVQNPSSKIVLVDVREPSELKDYELPHAINIPYKTNPDALQLNDAQFQSSMGFDKPSKDKELVFFCAKGIRASMARDIASINGYSYTAVYPGSMTEWLSKGGRDIK